MVVMVLGFGYGRNQVSGLKVGEDGLNVGEDGLNVGRRYSGRVTMVSREDGDTIVRMGREF